MERAPPLHHDRVLEHHVPAVQLGEVRDALAEEHRHEADTHLVHQSELERLLGDVGAGDRDVLVAGDLPCLRDRRLDAVDEGRPRPPLGGVRGPSWVTTTTDAPVGWLSLQPLAMSNSRRPETSTPPLSVSSPSASALASSTSKATSSLALATDTSPASYQSNSSPG
jgi:hypothetical protein